MPRSQTVRNERSSRRSGSLPHNERKAEARLTAPAGEGRPRDRAIVRVHLLGPMQATTYLGASVLPRASRARAVLGYLCLAGGEHVSRSSLAGLLWDRASERPARASLRQSLRDL